MGSERVIYTLIHLTRALVLPCSMCHLGTCTVVTSINKLMQLPKLQIASCDKHVATFMHLVEAAVKMHCFLFEGPLS